LRLRFNTSLLLTCKKIYQEASHVLFGINKILLWRAEELHKAVQLPKRQWTYFVRHLELMSIRGDCWLQEDSQELRQILEHCLAMPKLRSLSFAGDVKAPFLLS
jgi:hypothetical protein